MSIPLHIVNAFTTTPFGGNGAAVCLLEGPVDPSWMQQVATELAQPTTAFVHTDNGQTHLRWFTPTTELPLCGHATLAAAHVLLDAGGDLRLSEVDSPDAVNFLTPAGPLTVQRREGLLWLDLAPVPLQAASAPPGLAKALRIDPADIVWFGRHGDAEFVAVLDTAELVEGLRPDIERIDDLPVTRTIVTAAGGRGVDVTSRVFVPALGLAEDAATGSAHAVLGPLWRARLGRGRLRAVQASARRGDLVVEVDEQVRVGGGAVTVARGELVGAVPSRLD